MWGHLCSTNNKINQKTQKYTLFKKKKGSKSKKGTADSPIINPAFYVKDWNGELPRVLVDGKESDGTRLGLKHELDGTDLIIYLALSSDNEINIEITQ